MKRNRWYWRRNKKRFRLEAEQFSRTMIAISQSIREHYVLEQELKPLPDFRLFFADDPVFPVTFK